MVYPCLHPIPKRLLSMLCADCPQLKFPNRNKDTMVEEASTALREIFQLADPVGSLAFIPSDPASLVPLYEILELSAMEFLFALTMIQL